MSTEATRENGAGMGAAAEEVLRRRAEVLARRAEGTGEVGAGWEVLEFVLGGERYGVELGCVREVFSVREITPVPGVPDFVVGILNVRGQVVVVVDLRKFFGLPKVGISDLNKVLFVAAGGREMGWLADGIMGVRRLGAGELQAAGPALEGLGVGRVRGLGPGGLVVLDVEGLLGDEGMVVNDGAGG